MAVGTNQEVSRLAGPGTRRIDLRGRSVIPGLIDHHGHYLREGSTSLDQFTDDKRPFTREELDRMCRSRDTETR